MLLSAVQDVSLQDAKRHIARTVQGEAAGAAAVVQRMQRSISRKTTPLMALAGLAMPASVDSQRAGSSELIPLKSVKLQSEALTPGMEMQGSQSIEPLLQTGEQSKRCSAASMISPAHQMLCTYKAAHANAISVI